MSRQDEIKRLLINHHRRLQLLREQQALKGTSASPELILEIEDIEAAIAPLQAELAELQAQADSQLDAPVSLAGAPYRGLEVFDVEHAHLFFGRETLTHKLLDRLNHASFLAVIGPSGSGKSSVVRAGLLHQIEQGALPNSVHWPVVVITPTAMPLEPLATGLRQRLLPDLGPMAVLKDLETDERRLAMLVRAAALPENTPLLLVIDQFEELFTLCRSETHRQQYLANLLYAVRQENSPVKLVLTMRADFYGKCASYPDLAVQMEQSQVIVGPMTDEEVREAILAPADLAGLTVEPELVTEILADVHAQPGELPLLQYALLELWKQRTDNRLTLAGYSKIGRVQGALARRADAIYQHLPESDQNYTRQILIRLTELGEGTEDTRRRAKKEELITLNANGEAVEAVLKQLSDERLITTSRQLETGEEWVDVAHEALIRGWPRLQEWLSEDREALRTQRQLTEAAQEWARHHKEASFLYQGGRLAATSEWIKTDSPPLNALETEFVQASAVAEHRRKRILWSSIGLAFVLISGLAIVAIIFALKNGEQATNLAAQADELATAVQEAGVARETAVAGEQAAQLARATAVAGADQARRSQAEAEYQARAVLARQLAGQAAFYRQRDPQLALLLAMEAISATYRTDGYTTLDAATVLRGLLTGEYQTVMATSGHTDDVSSAAFSPDGQKIVTASWDNTARVWDAASGQERVKLEGHTDGVTSAAFSPDGQKIVTASGDNTARVWDAASGQELAKLAGHTGSVYSAAFSPDGQKIVTASGDNTARVWDAASGQELAKLAGHTGSVYSAAFSPDGQKIVTASDDNTARVWQQKRSDQLLLSGHNGSVFQAKFDPAGERVVSAGGDGVARVWAAATGELLVRLAGHGADSKDEEGGQVIQAVAFSPSGQQIATAGWDGTARLWDAASGQQLHLLKGHTERLLDAVFSPDGRILATSAGDGSTHLWNTANGQILHVISGTNHIAFSPDSALIATPGISGTVSLWDVQTGQKRFTLTSAKQDQFVQVVFSPDGAHLAAGGFKGAAFIWAVTGEQLAKLAGHTDTIYELAYSPDGTLIATAGADGTVRLWDAQTGAERFELRGHELPVRSVAFSPNGKQLASGGDDGAIRLWNTQTGALEAILPDVVGTKLVVTWTIDEKTNKINNYYPERDPAFVLDVNYSPSGDRVVAAGLDGSVAIYIATIDRLLELAQTQVTRSLTCQERVQFLFEKLDCSVR